MLTKTSILRVVSKLLIPPIMLFALYVQFHGDFGPGGGFQAGVIFASAFILYALIFGVDNARKVAPAWLTRLRLAAGLLPFPRGPRAIKARRCRSLQGTHKWQMMAR